MSQQPDPLAVFEDQVPTAPTQRPAVFGEKDQCLLPIGSEADRGEMNQERQTAIDTSASSLLRNPLELRSCSDGDAGALGIRDLIRLVLARVEILDRGRVDLDWADTARVVRAERFESRREVRHDLVIHANRAHDDPFVGSRQREAERCGGRSCAVRKQPRRRRRRLRLGFRRRDEGGQSLVDRVGYGLERSENARQDRKPEHTENEGSGKR